MKYNNNPIILRRKPVGEPPPHLLILLSYHPVIINYLSPERKGINITTGGELLKVDKSDEILAADCEGICIDDFIVDEDDYSLDYTENLYTDVVTSTDIVLTIQEELCFESNKIIKTLISVNDDLIENYPVVSNLSGQDIRLHDYSIVQSYIEGNIVTLQDSNVSSISMHYQYLLKTSLSPGIEMTHSDIVRRYSHIFTVKEIQLSELLPKNHLEVTSKFLKSGFQSDLFKFCLNPAVDLVRPTVTLPGTDDNSYCVHDLTVRSATFISSQDLIEADNSDFPLIELMIRGYEFYPIENFRKVAFRATEKILPVPQKPVECFKTCKRVIPTVDQYSMKKTILTDSFIFKIRKPQIISRGFVQIFIFKDCVFREVCPSRLRDYFKWVYTDISFYFHQALLRLFIVGFYFYRALYYILFFITMSGELSPSIRKC
jgi:hypothetical protein